MKLIIDLIPIKHNMLKDLYQMVVGLGVNYEKIDACQKNCMLFWMDHKTISNVCIVVGLDR